MKVKIISLEKKEERVLPVEDWRELLDDAQKANAVDAQRNAEVNKPLPGEDEVEVEEHYKDPYPYMTKFQKMSAEYSKKKEQDPEYAQKAENLMMGFAALQTHMQESENSENKEDRETLQIVAFHSEALARVACNLYESESQKENKESSETLLTIKNLTNLQEAFKQRLHEGLLGKPPTSVKTWATIGLVAGALICGIAALVCNLSIPMVSDFLLETASNFISLVDIPTELAIGLLAITPPAAGAAVSAGIGASFRFFEDRKVQTKLLDAAPSAPAP